MKFEIKSRWSNSVQFTAEIDAKEDDSYSLKVGLAVKWALEAKVSLSDANLSGADLSDANLRDANLRDAYLSGADLRGANLSGANLSDADLSDANLSDANLSDADLSDADLSDANLSGADLRGANLSDADLSDANLSDANLSDANLSDANLSDANLSDANLSGADLSGADLRGANLRSFKADLWMVLTQNHNEVPGLVEAMREGRIDGSVYSGECACLKGTIAKVRGVSADVMDQDVSQPAEQWFLMINKGDKPGDDTGGGFALKQALEWTEEWCALSGVVLPVVGFIGDKS